VNLTETFRIKLVKPVTRFWQQKLYMQNSQWMRLWILSASLENTLFSALIKPYAIITSV